MITIFFKFALGSEDEDVAFICNTVIKRVTENPLGRALY